MGRKFNYHKFKDTMYEGCAIKYYELYEVEEIYEKYSILLKHKAKGFGRKERRFLEMLEIYIWYKKGFDVDPADNLEFIKLKQRNDFKFKKQSYDKGYPKTIICKKCGNDKFIIGQGDYYTAIKCPNCGYEIEIHEG